MGTTSVVVGLVLGQDCPQMPLAEDQSDLHRMPGQGRWPSSGTPQGGCALPGASVVVQGPGHVRLATGYVAVSDHHSNLEPMVHLRVLPPGLRVLAKRETFRIRLLGLQRPGPSDAGQGNAINREAGFRAGDPPVAPSGRHAEPAPETATPVRSG